MSSTCTQIKTVAKGRVFFSASLVHVGEDGVVSLVCHVYKGERKESAKTSVLKKMTSIEFSLGLMLREKGKKKKKTADTHLISA